MEVEFLTADTTLPPCLPLPGAMLGLPVSSTAKVMYARLLGEIYTCLLYTSSLDEHDLRRSGADSKRKIPYETDGGR